MRLLIIVIVLFGTVCAVPLQSRIVGGNPTTIEKYPFMAAILVQSGDGDFFQYCGGTLVSSSSVVSAAHCYEGLLEVQYWRVLLGTNDVTSGGTEHTLSKIIMHPEFTDILVISDIAVVRLRRHAVLSEKIQIARIAGPRYPLPDNSIVNAVGWGALRYEGPSPNILQEVVVNVINHQTCTERYTNLAYVITPEMLCTGILDVGGKDACNGDSGGPVIHNRDILVGVTSWGYECAHPTYPGINVRVSLYADWIYANSLNNNASS